MDGPQACTDPPPFPLLLPPLTMFLLRSPQILPNVSQAQGPKDSAEVGRTSKRIEFGEFQFYVQSSFYLVHGASEWVSAWALLKCPYCALEMPGHWPSWPLAQRFPEKVILPRGCLQNTLEAPRSSLKL